MSEQQFPQTSPALPWRNSQILNPVAWWRYWITPRSTDRDKAFREVTIRATVAVLLFGATLSLIASYVVYESPNELVSYPTLMGVLIVTLATSAITVARLYIDEAALMLVLSGAIGALGVALIDGFWAYLNPPTVMVIILIAGLVLPRKLLLPVGAILVAGFSVIALLQEASGRQPIPTDVDQPVAAMDVVFNVFFLVLVEVLFLRQLRIEFDSRLAAMSESMEQTEQARREADRANQAKSRFLASMSHEFRTPLNAIIGYADIMIAGMAGALSDKQTQIQTHIRHNSKRLLAMINNTLDMAKIEAGRVEVHVSEIAPQEVIGQIVGGMESLAQNKGITLTAIFADSVPATVVCDSPKLQQVLTNLVGNALKFTTEGGVYVEVGGRGSDRWYVKVKDTGMGMPQDAATYIFDAFSQVDTPEARGKEGTGLGLAIVKRHVDYMGGHIEVETALGKGTTFTVTLPCQVQETIYD
jgi:signal transduction histidine kinase